MRSLLNITQLDIGYSLSHSKKKTVLADIDFEVIPGELICLIGANGTGKSTLLRTIAGLQPPLAGNIVIADKNLNDLDAYGLAKRLSLVLTETISAGNMSVYELVSLGRFPYTHWSGRLSVEDKEIIRQAMNFVGVEEMQHRNIFELSDGERQKAMIARALAQDTELILLDEPTAFLDLPYRTEILSLLRNLTRQRNKSIILSIHDLELALRIADKLILLTKDERYQIGVPEDLVLNDALGDSFSTDKVKFDKMEGTFKFGEESCMEIGLKGEGVHYVWTERALNRIGYEVNNDLKNDYIEILIEDDQPTWETVLDGEKIQHHSIAELVAKMKRP